MDNQTVGEVLQRVLDPGTAQDATNQMKDLMKQSGFVISLGFHVAQNPNSAIRQLAAVLLRRRLNKAWGTLSVDVRSQMKAMLLERLVQDPVHIVRLSLAHVVSSLGKLILLEWKNELFAYLQRCAESEQESHREVAQMVFSSILDSMADALNPLFDEFAKVFLRGLKDPTSAAVRLAAMKGVAALAQCADSPEDFSRLRNLLPPMVDVTREALRGGLEDVVVFAQEIFTDLAEAGDTLKPDDMPSLIRLMLEIVATPEIETGVKEQGLNFIHTIGKQSPKALTKANLVPEILDIVIPMALQPEGEHEQDELTPQRICAQCVDSLALNLPSRFVFQPVIDRVAPALKSEDPWQRRGALILIGVMSEGCEDMMRKKIEEFVALVLGSFSDPSPLVKAAAGVALGQMAEYLQPEITKCHAATMNVLLKAMRDPMTGANEDVSEKLCYAVELFCDHLEEFEIEAYLPELMPSLLHALSSAKGNRARENCIGAIGSAAQAGKAKFIPYVPQTFTILNEAIRQTTDDLILLRSRATSAAGSIIQSLPREATAAYHSELIQLVLQGLDTVDRFDLRESSHRFFGCLSYCLKDDMAALVPKLMPYVLASLSNSEGIETQYEETEDPLEGVDSEEEEEDERRIKGIHIRNGFIDEQEAALDLLCSLYRNVSGTHMAPWLKGSLEAANQFYKYFHSGIRQCVPNLMQAMLVNVHYTFLPDWAPRAEAGSPTTTAKNAGSSDSMRSVFDNWAVVTTSDNRGWVPGLPCQSPLHDHTIQLWVEKLWPLFYEMLKEDDDKEVIGDVCSAIGELLELLGPHLLHGSTLGGYDVHTCVVNMAVDLFSGEHVCQKFDEGEIDEDEDSRAIEEYLFEGLSSLVSGLAQTMGPLFQTPFRKMHPKILRLATHKKSSAYRCIGIGCYADVFRSMGATAIPFLDPLIDPSLSGLIQTGDISLKRNAAYFVGIIAEIGCHLPAVRSKLLDILKALYPIVTASPEGMREAELCVRDNAIAAIGRIIRGCPASEIPLMEIVPVFVQSLPLRADFEESEGVLKTLSHLYRGGCSNELLQAHQGHFLKAVVGELVNGSVTKASKEEAKTILCDAIRALGPQHPVTKEIAGADPRYCELLNGLAGL